MQIPVHFNPRPYQVEALQALESGVSTAFFCWARRGGKDLTAFAYAVKKMVEAPINVVLVFPTKEQGKTSFWDNIENDGFKTIEHIPKGLISHQDNTTMRIRLKNGSVFQILGTTDPDALRGANGKIYIFSEFVDHPTSVLDIVRPIVAANGGQIIIISTPKIDGISGASFEALFKRALNHPNQFASLVTAREYLSEATLNEIREEVISRYGNDFFFRQEFLCDFGQAGSSSYYGHALQLAEQRGLIGLFPYDHNYPVFTSWDLGMSDNTAIPMWQYFNKRIRIIDYFETNDIGLEPIVQFIQSKPYNFAWHFLPHDGSVRDSDAITRIEKIRDLGLINSSLLSRESVEDGITRAVAATPKVLFHEPTTRELRRKLLLYKRKFNPVTGDYVGPDHKTESHAADGYRYIHTAIDQNFDKKTGEFLYSPEGQPETYQSQTVILPKMYSPYGF